MGRVWVFGMYGLVVIGLLVLSGLSLRAMIRIYVGKKEKRIEAAQSEDRYCHCGNPDTCPQYGPYRLHKHD